MTRLSVNINKFATLRNSRGGNNPDIVKAAIDAQQFGAEGITVHPRPDERHITYRDVMDLIPVINTEFNIEGYPDKRYLDIVSKAHPAQAPLVPDSPEVLTSNTGWDTIRNQSYLKEIIMELKRYGVRVSIFIDPLPGMVEGAAGAGADRVELYTEPFAIGFKSDRANAVKPYVECSMLAHELDLGVNAGHDLDLFNLKYLKDNLPYLDEVSIGHALVCDSLYLGFENSIQLYLNQLR